MLNPKTNVGKLRNDVFMSKFAYFQNGRQNIKNLLYIYIFFLSFIYLLSLPIK